MPRWNAWQWRLGRPGNGDAADALGAVARRACRDRNDGAVVDADANVVRPAGRQQRMIEKQLASQGAFSAAAGVGAAAGLLDNRRRCAFMYREWVALQRSVHSRMPCGSTRSGSMRGWRRSRPAGPGSGSSSAARIAAKDGRIAFAGPVAELPTGWDASRARRARRPLGHARADRLPHAPRLCGRPRAGVRVAPRRRVTTRRSRGRAAASSRP